jgi:nitrogen-specific signal transduction histidine kinase
MRAPRYPFDARARQSALLSEVLPDIMAAASPPGAADALLHACIKQYGADQGQLYLLDLSTGSLRPYAALPDGTSDGLLAIRADDQSVSPISDLETLLAHSQSDHDQEGVVITARRGNTCIGAIRLDGVGLFANPVLREDLSGLTALLAFTYEKRFVHRLITMIGRPLDFTAPENHFFTAIADQLCTSTGMSFVVLREYDPPVLRCIALAGLGGLRSSDWDITIDSTAQFEVTMIYGAEQEFPLDKLTTLKPPIRSFVSVPIFADESLFGTLSFGAQCHFNYTPIEIRAFESVGSGVGVSIANYRNRKRIASEVSIFTETAAALTSLEVARSVRHEASNYIAVASTALRNLWMRLGKPSDDAEIDSAANALAKLSESLNKFTFAPLLQEWETLNLRQVIEEAATAITGRLDREHVALDLDIPSDLQVYGARDHLRQVFLNLLINSVDAFRETRKAGRSVSITFRPSSSKETTLMYRDNATGINPARLRTSEGNASLPLNQKIFLAGVSSKENGSGFGLWLVRSILGRHHASIDLVDHRRGVTFTLRFLPPYEAELRMQQQ